ncbi:hypothetical protein [Neokomagataea anthophila]|uniref:Tetratricopeptide repeat protein n=1 Tax=Neokomagataea anthophila TaxID=2826925 RepID=A0ABS5E5W7_9PROT|nr:hypothetical protein [Neokomagataea anthophila]MBR0559287.1 hypothetical protein [Neokomagataea anthophila]
MRYWTLLGALCFGACASHSGSVPLPDELYQTAMSTGKSAFELGHPEEAERQYQQAFRRAVVRDDIAALHDAGFNLATTQLEQHKPALALKTLDQLGEALLLRQQAASADLALVRAAALLQMGRAGQALSAARGAQETGIAEDRVRAGYLVGRAAFLLKKPMVVMQEASALCSVKGVGQSAADCLDLRVRHALLQGEGRAALPQAMALVGQRRDARDYDGMRDALSLAADAASQAGDVVQARSLKQRSLASQAAAGRDGP